MSDLTFLDQLCEKPFNLDSGACAWVEQTFARLDEDAKIGQVFVLMSREFDDAHVDEIAQFQPGGLTRFCSGGFEDERAMVQRLQTAAAVPLLVSADLEGSLMSLPFGTEVPNPLALAAVDDAEATRAVGTITAQEARAVGINWSFTPVLDINAAFQSAIVATRSFGDDIERISRHAGAMIDALQANGIAATAKHWPGEGYDDRDQHLVMTVNPLSLDEWRASFGRLYSMAIEQGIKSIMSAHIAFPAYAAQFEDPSDTLAVHRPATLSKLLNQRLLREEMGFNGLVVSDATLMAGLTEVSPRSEHLPEIIENGCDVILFSPDVQADFATLKRALADGRLSHARLDEAVLRVLALKASLGLHQPASTPALPDPSAARALAQSITQRVPTLVKDVQGLLPLDASKHRRIYLYGGNRVSPMTGAQEMILAQLLEEEGFDVQVHDPAQPGLGQWAQSDLVLYAFAEETLLTRERIFFDWARTTGFFLSAMERPWHHVPCAMISFGYPYYLYDAPRMPCVINAYMATDGAQRAVVECLMGRSPFNQTSPVDPFCGQDIARF
ncbi:MAG: glycoside hydrolase family 3 protein [Alphaproteobacteria bacterium]